MNRLEEVQEMIAKATAKDKATIAKLTEALETIANSTYPLGADGLKVWQDNCHTARAALAEVNHEN